MKHYGKEVHAHRGAEKGTFHRNPLRTDKQLVYLRALLLRVRLRLDRHTKRSRSRCNAHSIVNGI